MALYKEPCLFYGIKWIKGEFMASSPSNKPKVKNVRTQPLDSNVQFLCWSYPKYTPGNTPLAPDALCQHPNITVIANAQLGNINAISSPSYFNGYDNYTITGEQNWYCKEAATSVGKRWADSFEMQGLTYDPKNKKNRFGENGSRFAGGIFAQDWGCHVSPSVIQNYIMKNPDDLLWYTDPATNGKIGIPAGWHKNACKKLSTITQLQKLEDKATLSLGDFIMWAAFTMKQECDARNLCYPKYLAWDYEGGAGVYFAADSNNNSGSIIGFDGVKSKNPAFSVSNAFDLIMQDPRFKTEVVYDEWDGRRWVGKTLHDAYTECGYGAENKGYTAGTKEKPIYWFQDINRDFVRKMESYYHRINDHAMHSVLYAPMKKIFRNIICGNYNFRHELSSAITNQSYETRNLFARVPFKDFALKKYLRADYQSPVCYSVDMAKGKYTADTFQPADVIEKAAPNGFYYYNAHALGKTPQEIYRNCMVQYVRACTAVCKERVTGNPINVIPWIEPPHEKTGGDLGITVYEATEDDILFILKEHWKLGVRTWLVFNALANYDLWSRNTTNPGDDPSVRVKKFIKVVDDFVAWTKTQ